jgi:hypothetical protein
MFGKVVTPSSDDTPYKPGKKAISGCLWCERTFRTEAPLLGPLRDRELFKVFRHPEVPLGGTGIVATVREICAFPRKQVLQHWFNYVCMSLCLRVYLSMPCSPYLYYHTTCAPRPSPNQPQRPHTLISQTVLGPWWAYLGCPEVRVRPPLCGFRGQADLATGGPKLSGFKGKRTTTIEKARHSCEKGSMLQTIATPRQSAISI